MSNNLFWPLLVSLWSLLAMLMAVVVLLSNMHGTLLQILQEL